MIIGKSFLKDKQIAYIMRVRNAQLMAHEFMNHKHILTYVLSCPEQKEVYVTFIDHYDIKDEKILGWSMLTSGWNDNHNATNRLLKTEYDTKFPDDFTYLKRP